MEFRLQRIALTFALLACEPGVDAQEASHLPAEAPPIGTMRKALLQDSKPYEVGIGAIPTTILMPAPIEAFEGNNISTTPGVPTIAFLQHTPGTRFFSVKAVIPGTADLNVIIGDAVFSFRFTFSMNPTRTLTIEVPGKARAEKPARTVHITARRLYEITQDAKTYFTVAQQYPEFDRAIEVTTPGKIIEYPGYRLVIDQVFRFDRDDTLVFRVAFLNDTASPRYYKPAEIGLRIGRNIYWPSFAQVSGSMAPRVPARIAWDVSPDVGSIIVKNPAGQVADLSDRSMAELGELGTYTIIATAKDGRVRRGTSAARMSSKRAGLIR